MKRFTLAVLAGLMVMAFASVAAAEITVGGSIDIRYDLWQDINLNSRATNYQTINFFDERVMLNVDAKITEGLEAFIELDTDNTDWGLGTTAGNIPFYLNHLGNTVAVRQAWINFMVPGLPVGMKIGHQPLALGHGIWLDTHRYGSDAILVYSKPMPELLVAAAYVQGSQSLPSTPVFPGAFNRIGAGLGTDILATGFFSSEKNDADFYAVLANFTWMENNTVGVNLTYVDDKASIGNNIWATNAAIVLDGAIAGLNYKGEVDWLYVNTEDIFGADRDYLVNAWAMMLGVNMNVMNMVNVGAEVAYGTGNDDNRPGIFYNPGAAMVGAVTNRMDHAYYTPYNSTSYNYAFLYNDKIGQGPLGVGGGFGFGDGFGGFGLANTGYVKVSVGMNPTDRLKVGMDALYLRASETMIAGQSRDLGWEVDANIGYKLYDNLNLDVTGGVFIPGAWYAFQGHAPVTSSTAILTDSGDPSSPIKRSTAWGMETKLSVKF